MAAIRRRNQRCIQRSKRGPSSSRTTRLGLEYLEDRRVLATLTLLTPGEGLSPGVETAFERVSQLDQYTDQQLANADDWVVYLEPGTTQAELASHLGIANQSLSSPSWIDNTFVGPTGDAGELSNAAAQQSLAGFDGARYFYPLVSLNRATKAIPNDPLFVWAVPRFPTVSQDQVEEHCEYCSRDKLSRDYLAAYGCSCPRIRRYAG